MDPFNTNFGQKIHTHFLLLGIQGDSISSLQFNLNKCVSHIHYVNALLQYVKAFCVKFSEVTLYISADDKAIVPVGEPGLPVSTGVRGHNRSLVPQDGVL